MKCKPGYYYCYTDKKCKKMPMGYHIGRGGYLAKDDNESSEDGKKNGNGKNGNDNGVSEDLRDWFGKSKSKDGKPGWVQSDGSPCANEKGETKTPKCFSSQRLASLKAQGSKGKAKIAAAVRRKREQDSGQQQKSGGAKPTMVKTFAKKDDYKKHPSGDRSESTNYDHLSPISRKILEQIDGEKELQYLEEKNKPTNPSLWSRAKALARSKFDVYPSAYANGWAAKWYKKRGGGWKSVSEEVVAEHHQKDKDGNTIPHEEVEVSEARKPGESPKEYAARMTKKYSGGKSKTYDPMKDKNFDHDKAERTRGSMEEEVVDEAVRIPAQTGNVYGVVFSWRAKMYMLKLFFPEIRKPKRDEVEDAIRKLYPGSTLRSFNLTPFQPGDSYVHAGMGEDVEEDSLGKLEEGTPAWQRKAGKDPSGGLNQKGVDSYRRANPGSKLQTAVTTKPSKLKKGSKDAKRRKSFCARMKGMKKRLTSAKTARDPDSRINKSLRKWNC